jgi:hypothetical protein
MLMQRLLLIVAFIIISMSAEATTIVANTATATLPFHNTVADHHQPIGQTGGGVSAA